MTQTLINWIRGNIARGYQRETSGPSRVICVLTEAGRTVRLPEEQSATRFGSSPRSRSLGILCPTFVGRMSFAEHFALLTRLTEQVRDLAAAFPDVEVFFFVGMQWQPGEEEESLHRLEQLPRLVEDPDTVRFIGISLPGPGKARTLNSAIRLANGLELDGLAWIDDDVTLEPRCLEHMVRRFYEKGCRGALGATKVPMARSNFASRLLYNLKAVTTPACNYPHACCILVERRVIASGIPERYASDDGFVCFELLDPSLPNPLEWLELVTPARCWHHVGGPAGETTRRIRRMLTNHHVFLADYPIPVARYYFSEILFFGLWPLAPWDGSRGVAWGCAKWFLKALYLVWFFRVGAGLFLRGLTGRPIREIKWGGYTEYEAPAIPAGPGKAVE